MSRAITISSKLSLAVLQRHPKSETGSWNYSLIALDQERPVNVAICASSCLRVVISSKVAT